MELFEIKSSFGDSYTFSYESGVLSIDAYLKGSITGGSGTERKSEVTESSLVSLLQYYSAETPAELFKVVNDFSQNQKDEFINVLRDFENVTFIWSETDWSDD